MFRISFFSCTLFLLFACKNAGDGNKNTSDTLNGPIQILGKEVGDTSLFTTIQWLDSVKSFNNVTEGQKLEVAFRFKNTGSKPLIIESVQPSCGCTVANPPKEPVLPGNEGVINGTFDSNGRVGTNHKTLYITANTKGSQSHELKFDVEVVKSNK